MTAASDVTADRPTKGSTKGEPSLRNKGRLTTSPSGMAGFDPAAPAREASLAVTGMGAVSMPYANLGLRVSWKVGESRVGSPWLKGA